MKGFVYLILVVLFQNTLYSYELDVTKNNPPYSTTKFLELSVPVGDQAITTLKGKDPEGGKVYFKIENTPTLQFGRAKIINGNQLQYTANKNIQNVTPHGLQCKDSGSICDYVKYKVIDENGISSKDVYTVNIRIQEVIDKDNYNPNPVGKFNVRAFNNRMLNNMANSKGGGYMDSNNPTEAISKSTNSMFGGAVKYASSHPNAAQFSSSSMKSGSARQALLNMQGANGTLAKDDTIIDEGFWNDMKKMSYRHAPQTEQVLKTCRIERAGGVLKKFFVCPLDTNYPDHLDQATLFRAEHGYEKRAQSSCEQTCVERASCNLVLPTKKITLFKNKTFLKKSEAEAIGRLLEDQNVTKLTVVIQDGSGNIINKYSNTFTPPLDGSEFHWDIDMNQASTIYHVPNSNISFVTNIADPSKTSDYYHYASSTGELEITVPRFFWIKFGAVSTEPVDNRLYSVTAEVQHDMYRCPINNIAEPSLLYDTKNECENICSLPTVCVSYSYLDTANFDKIENHCKDMKIMYENQPRTLSYLANQGKCRIYDEAVYDFQSKPKHFYVKDFAISDPLRPFGELNDSITEFPTQTSELANENVLGVVGAFSNMIQTVGSKNNVLSSLPLGSDEYYDLKGKKINHLFYPFSLLLNDSGRTNTKRTLALVVRPNPTIVKQHKDDNTTQNYGFVAISFEPEIHQFSNSNETHLRYFFIAADGKRYLVRDLIMEGGYNRATMRGEGTVIHEYKADLVFGRATSFAKKEHFSNDSKYKYLDVNETSYEDVSLSSNDAKFILYDNNNTDEDLDNAFYNYNFMSNVNFLDNHESKLFVYYAKYEDLNGTNIQDIIDTIDADYRSEKKYLACDYYYESDILQARADVNSIHSDGKGNYIVNFGSKEIYGPLSTEYKKYLKYFHGHSDISSFLFDEAGLRDDKIAISRRGVASNMSIDVKIGPDINETKNGYYFVYFKKDNSDDAYFVLPVSTSGNYMAEAGNYKCDITNDIFSSQKSCNNYCLNSDYITSTEPPFPLLSHGNCIELGGVHNATGVLYNDIKSCEDAAKLPAKTNATANLINARIRYIGGGQPLTSEYNTNLYRYKHLGDTSPYLDYSTKIVKHVNLVDFGQNNTIDLFLLKKNEKLVFEFNSIPDGSNYFSGLGRWDLDDINKTLGRPPTVSDIFIPGQNTANCYNIQKFYNGTKFVLELDKDFDGIYEDSIDLMEPHICIDSLTMNDSLKIEFLGDKIRYEYMSQTGEKETKVFNLKFKQEATCRVMTSQEQDDALANGEFATKWNSLLPQQSITNDISALYISGAEANLSNLSEFKNTRTGETEKIFLKKVDTSDFGMIGDNNIATLKHYLNDYRKIPIPIDFGAYTNDKENLNFRKLNATHLGDYKMYAGYGHVPWSNCLEFKAPITVTENVTVQTQPPSNGCPSGYTYNSVAQHCERNIMYYDSVCTNLNPQAYYDHPTNSCRVSSSNSAEATVSLGTVGNDYWGDGTHYDDAYVTITDVNDVETMTLNSMIFDDWMMVKVNGTIVHVGPYGGDMLDWTAHNPPIQYQSSPPFFGSPELSTSWNQNPNIDLKPYLVNGVNHFQFKVIVAGAGEGYAGMYVTYHNNTMTCGSGCSISSSTSTCPPGFPNKVGSICTAPVQCSNEIAGASNQLDIGGDQSVDKCIYSFVDPCPSGTHYNNENGKCEETQLNLTTQEKTIKVCKPWWIIQRTYKCDPDVVNQDYIEDRLSFSYPRKIQMCKQKEVVPKIFSVDSKMNKH